MSKPMTPLEKQQRQAAEVYAPQGAALLHKWRIAIQNGARAHEAFHRMTDGPDRRRLLGKLRSFDAQRVAAARAITNELSRNEGTVVDFEAVAGTALLTTNPGRPSTGTVAAASQLGFVFALIIGAASILGVYAISKELWSEIKWSVRTLVWVSIAGAAMWGVYKIYTAKPEAAATARVGEVYR